MNDRTKLLLFVIIALALLAPGCGFSQQSRFQTSFLPPAPRTGGIESVVIEPPPDVQPNLYLKDVPPFLLAQPQALSRRSQAADALARRADQSFARGRKFYQEQELTNARREFDTAIDLMLEAAAQEPLDRQQFERHLDEMVEAIHRLDLAGMGAGASLEEGKFEKAPLEDILEMTFPVDPRLKDRVREQVAATVSQLPLSVNNAVLGYINFFSNRGHRTLLAAYGRSGRYRPMIQRILDEEGVPQELIHLAQAESGFIPRAMSSMAAGGMWQFLAWRGQQYGLMRTPLMDERMDPEKATRAAAHHLRDLYTEFGDWYLAIAAYNCGPGVVERAVERTGHADFWELRSRSVLPAETTNYVPIILAMTIMEKNAAEYGLEGAPLDPPLEYDTIEAAAPTSLSLVADIADTPVAELAALNPALLKGMAPAGYSLHVPKGTGNQLMAALQMVPAEHRDAWRLHRVGSGETVESIAQRYRTTPAVILAANNLKSAEAQAGDRLVIPAVLRAAAPVRKAAAARRTTATRRTVGRTHTRSASASASRPASRRTTRPVKSAAAPRRTKSTVILAKAAR